VVNANVVDAAEQTPQNDMDDDDNETTHEGIKFII